MDTTEYFKYYYDLDLTPGQEITYNNIPAIFLKYTDNAAAMVNRLDSGKIVEISPLSIDD